MSADVARDGAAAERRAERIRLRLDSIADNIGAVLPMIREAIEAGDHATLGYRSVGEYVQDRFGGALSRLPVDLRRPVVHELAAAGMSTRAIAPVVGTSHMAVKRDLDAGVTTVTPAINAETGEVSDDYAEPVNEPAPEPRAARPAVVGIDGKTYTRPEPKASKRRDLTDAFFDAIYDLTKATERVHALTADDRFPQNAEKVAAKHRNDLIRINDLMHEVASRLAIES